MAAFLTHLIQKQRTRHLGEVLRDHPSVRAEMIERALNRQQREGGRLGELMVMDGAINWRELAAALARQEGLTTVDLLREPCDISLLDPALRESYHRHGWVPWRMEEGRLVIATLYPTREVHAEIRAHLPGIDHEFVLTSPRDIQRTLARVFTRAIDQESRFALMQRFPVWSAHRQSGDRWALAFILALLAAIPMALFSTPALQVVVALSNIGFFGSLLLKWTLFHEGRTAPWPKTPVELLTDDTLPVYTVLVAMYREAASAAGLVEALSALDYPKHLLDIKLVIEADDEETYQALVDARPPAYMEILRVPYSHPRTKPKACNYALQFARGEYLTIYDAEDKPAPDQLKKAVALFRASSPAVACLQARLNYYNREEKLLTRLFALEYAILFDYLIPGMQARGIPIPLGGTSNHMSVAMLRRLKGWDPFNVTEDADLGLRMAAAGYLTLPLNSLTMEEAPLMVRAWLKQRSRWIKGYLVTWIVHTRRPRLLMRHCGPFAMTGLYFLIGGASLVYLIAPFLWAISLYWALGIADAPPLPPMIGTWCMLTLVGGLLVQWHSAWRVVRDKGWNGMRLAILVFPFYWCLHSIASFRSLWQLFLAPSHWDKTTHGVTAVKDRKIPSKTTVSS